MIICKKCKQTIADSFVFCPFCGKPTAPVRHPKHRRERGTGSVYKMSGNRKAPWGVFVNRKYIKSFTTKVEAEEYLVSIQGMDKNKFDYTVEDMYNKWINSDKYLKLADSTKRNTVLSWKYLESIKGLPMHSVTTSLFQDVINNAFAKGAGTLCLKMKDLISHICKEALKEDIIKRNFSSSLELPEMESSRQGRNFTDEEIIKLLDKDNEPNVRIILCLIYSGARQEDLFSVKKENVFLDKKYMVGGSKTEAGKNRIIPIRDEVYPYIEDFMKTPGEYLFINSRGNRLKQGAFRSTYYKTLEHCGITYTDESGEIVLNPHRSRHTYIANAIESGVAPEALTKIVGHTDYDKITVGVYADDLKIDYLRKEASKGF